jgi:hypothetical protein
MKQSARAQRKVDPVGEAIQPYQVGLTFAKNSSKFPVTTAMDAYFNGTCGCLKFGEVHFMLGRKGSSLIHGLTTSCYTLTRLNRNCS